MAICHCTTEAHMQFDIHPAYPSASALRAESVRQIERPAGAAAQ